MSDGRTQDKLSFLILSFSMTAKTTEEAASIRSIIKSLVLEPETFGPEQAAQAMHAIMGGHATTSQISAFLIGLKLQGKDLDAEIVAACAETMRAFALPIHYSEHAHLESCVVDIVGTGGDGHNTYNVSTTASLVAAGAGAKVAKVRMDDDYTSSMILTFFLKKKKKLIPSL